MIKHFNKIHLVIWLLVLVIDISRALVTSDYSRFYVSISLDFTGAFFATLTLIYTNNKLSKVYVVIQGIIMATLLSVTVALLLIDAL